MSLTVTRSRVKEKCGITDTSYDSTIDNLILEIVPVLEYQISDDALADSSTGVQTTLNLAATEVICGELLAQRFRELGLADIVTIGDLKIEPQSPSQAFDLVERGHHRLQPFLQTNAYSDASRVSAGADAPEDGPL